MLTSSILPTTLERGLVLLSKVVRLQMPPGVKQRKDITIMVSRSGDWIRAPLVATTTPPPPAIMQQQQRRRLLQLAIEGGAGGSGNSSQPDVLLEPKVICIPGNVLNVFYMAMSSSPR
jgi:hypothetical protein